MEYRASTPRILSKMIEHGKWEDKYTLTYRTLTYRARGWAFS